MKSFNWIEISEKYNEGSRDVKFGFLNIQSSFATIWILFEVQKWLWWCCIVTATVQYELRYWYCAFRRSASFSLLVFGRRRTTVASSKCPIINWLQLTLLCSLGLPLLPLPRVELQRRRQRGIWSHFSTCAHPCGTDHRQLGVGAWHGWSITPCVHHAWSLIIASKKGPAAIMGVDFDDQLHRLITFD